MSACVSLLRFAQPYAVETSRLRQLDSFLVPILIAVSAVVILSALLIAFLKKPDGKYAPFGFALWGLSLMLYGVITPDRVIKVLYAPPLQKFVEQSGLHIDVTTIQSVKTITEALNLVACGAVVILGAAAVVALIRRLCVWRGKIPSFSLVLSAMLGLLFSCTVINVVSKMQGYSFTFIFLGCLMLAAGFAIWPVFSKKSKFE